MPGEAVARERAGQSFRTRLGAQTGLLGLPAPRLRLAATGSHVSTQSLIKGGLCPVLAPGSTSSRPTHLDAGVELNREGRFQRAQGRRGICAPEGAQVFPRQRWGRVVKAGEPL